MVTDISLVFAGLVALFIGGEGLVRGAIALASRLGLPALMISLTVVGFGTSMPELLVSVRAAMQGQPDIALGNVVGSNIANVLLIVGLSALISPMRNWDNRVKHDAVVMILAALIAFGLAQFGQISAVSGFAMVLLLAAYIATSYYIGQKREQEEQFEAPQDISRIRTGIYIFGGLALLFVGADALVRGATGIARDFGLSEAVIGLTIVAVGTSLPELATSLIAAVRRQSDIAIGNIVGSNIFNILGILGMTAILAPVGVAEHFRHIDIPVMISVSVVFAAMLLATKSIGRPAAIVLLAGYASYIFWLF